MNTFVAVLILSGVSATAFAVFSSTTLPEPGVLELVGIGGVVLVVARLLKRKK